MALRILWDRDEALILLDGLLSVLNGDQPRLRAVKAVSEELRQRAIDNGVEIDEVFRNTNGISMQMGVMEYIYTDGEHGLKKSSMPPLFKEVVTLYKTDRPTYEKLLKEARKLPEKISVKDEYVKWLAGKVTPAQLSEIYMVYDDIEKYFRNYGIVNGSLFETTDPEILKKIAYTINTSSMFQYTYRKKLSRMKAAIKYYRMFLAENPQYVNSAEPVTVQPEATPKPTPKPEIKKPEPVEKAVSEQLPPDIDISKIRTKFFEWAKLSSIPVPTAMQYLSALKKCTQAAQMLNIFKSDILTVTDADRFSEIKTKLISNHDFRDIDRTNKGKYSQALDVFEDYLRSYTPERAASKSFADDESAARTERAKFSVWMENSGMASATANSYLSAIVTCINKVKQLGIANRNLFVITDLRELDRIKTELFQDSSFKKCNEMQHNRFHAAFNKLIAFRMSQRNQYSYTSVPTRPAANTPSAKNVPTFSVEAESAARTEQEKLSIWMQESGMQKATTRWYISGVDKCIEQAYKMKLTEQNLFCITDLKELDRIKTVIMNDADFKAYDKEKHGICHAAFNKLIAFRMSQRNQYSYTSLPTHSAADTQQIKPVPKPTQTVKTRSAELSPGQKKYAAILEKYFSENGFRPKNAIDRGRFKKYYAEEYGKAPDDPDELISEILIKIGTEREGRIFPKHDKAQDSLVAEILSEIDAAFDSGASAVYVRAVYERFSDRLGKELNIYNEDALSELLVSSSNGGFTRSHSHFKRERRSSDTPGDILRILKASHSPKTYDEIHDEAWYIPYDKIRSSIMSLAAVVKAADKTYFYAPNLPVSAEELRQIAELIERELSYRSHITDSELIQLIEEKCPSAALNTESFTRYGLRNSLGYLLREWFSFKGPIITKRDKSIAVKDVYTEFARSHETLQYDELKQLADEMNVVIYWETVLTEMVRINENEFVRNDLITFDVERIDDILDEVCPEKYAPLKDVGLFLHFPNIGYKWNSFVLESYLFSHSRRFKLLHASFASSDVYGAMVRVDSGIGEYRELVVDVLSHSDALSSEKVAFEYLIDFGYQKRKALSGMDQLLKEAKLKKANKK